MLGILLVLLWGCVSVAFILTLKEHSETDKGDNDEASEDGTTKNKIIIATIRNGIEILQHKRIDHIIGQV